jgi:hypothetical protein
VSDSSTSWTPRRYRETGHDDVEERLDPVAELELLVESCAERGEELESLAHDPLRVVEQDPLERLSRLLRERGHDREVVRVELGRVIPGRHRGCRGDGLSPSLPTARGTPRTAPCSDQVRALGKLGDPLLGFGSQIERPSVYATLAGAATEIGNAREAGRASSRRADPRPRRTRGSRRRWRTRCPCPARRRPRARASRGHPRRRRRRPRPSRS